MTPTDYDLERKRRRENPEQYRPDPKLTEDSVTDPAIELSRAIRLTVEKHGPKLTEMSDPLLREFATILRAYSLDFNNELRNRIKASR